MSSVIKGSAVPPRWAGQVTPAQVIRARLAQPATHPAVVAPMPLRPISAGMLKG